MWNHLHAHMAPSLEGVDGIYIIIADMALANELAGKLCNVIKRLELSRQAVVLLH